MKEYKITMTFSIEAEDADYEKISEFAEDLSDRLMADENLNDDDIEIIDVAIQSVDDLNDYDKDDDFLVEDDDFDY